MRRRGSKDGTPLVPERIGRYEVLLPVASGGMGTVYLARSRGVGGFQREVALKVMHAHLREEEHFADDLIEEAKLAVRIQHPNVVQVLDVGEDPHGVFLVMEYIEGESLAGLQRASKKRDGRLPVPVGIRVLVDALLGLHAAHELRDEAGEPLGLVHRDFSPQNILIGMDGISKLTDFGVAKARTRLSHTATGLVKGKIHYMSPEQARSDPIDRRCDVWAAGVMVWETLAGKRLYTERSDASILLKLVTEPPPRLRTVSRDIPQALEDVVHHALATDVARRCPSAKLFADTLLEASERLGGAATHDEVAQYVREVSGPTLKKRREQIGEVVKLRQEIKTIAAESTVDTSDLTTSPAAGSHGVVPSVSDDLDDTTLDMSERAAPRREDEQTQATAATSTSAAPPSPSTPPSPSRRTAAAVGTLAAAAVLSTAVYVFTRPPAAAETSGAVTSALNTTAGPRPATSPPAATGAAAQPPESAKAMPVPSPAVKATFESNAPLVELEIGARTVAVDPPSSSVELTLTPTESASDQVVVAKSADGRVAKATLARGTGSLTIKFPTRVVQPSPPRPRPTVAPLATNPHQ